MAREAAEFGEQPFNREHVLFHLREGLEHTRRMIADLESDTDYDQPEFMVDMSHLYLHLNTAWNARTASAERVENCSQADFDAWRQFPDDLPMI